MRLNHWLTWSGALMALAMLTVAARPADDEHLYGHTKAEYFSSGLEGSLIIIAAASIAAAAVRRLIIPRELEQVGIGLAVSVVASLINLGSGSGAAAGPVKVAIRSPCRRTPNT